MRIIYSKQFKKDYKLAEKQKKGLCLLKHVIRKLANNESLEAKHYDHNLSGRWGSYRECHVQPDWILIYRINKKEKKLIIARLGTHSKLFK